MDDPDPLLPFLVPHTTESSPPRSATSPSFRSQQPPDPQPPSPDLSIDGPHSSSHHRLSNLEALTASGALSPSAPPNASPEESSHQSASPTEIDRELQEQGWALLPELATNLNKLRDQQERSGEAVGRSVFNPLLAHGHSVAEPSRVVDTSGRKTDHASIQSNARKPQEDTDIEVELRLSNQRRMREQFPDPQLEDLLQRVANNARDRRGKESLLKIIQWTKASRWVA
jgi:hypothetical protein